MTQTHHFSVTLIVLILFAAGCGGSSGPKTYRVEGTVTHNGIPLEGASVTFTSADGAGTGTSAGGRTDANGKYTLMSSFGANGAEPGTYNVTISKREAVNTGQKVLGKGPDGEDTMVDEVISREVLPAQYASSRNTPFKGVTVETKPLNTHDFNLE